MRCPQPDTKLSEGAHLWGLHGNLPPPTRRGLLGFLVPGLLQTGSPAAAILASRRFRGAFSCSVRFQQGMRPSRSHSCRARPRHPDLLTQPSDLSALPSSPLSPLPDILFFSASTPCPRPSVSHWEKAVLGKQGAALCTYKSRQPVPGPAAAFWGEAPGKALCWGQEATPKTEPAGAPVTLVVTRV